MPYIIVGAKSGSTAVKRSSFFAGTSARVSA